MFVSGSILYLLLACTDLLSVIKSETVTSCQDRVDAVNNTCTSLQIKDYINKTVSVPLKSPKLVTIVCEAVSNLYACLNSQWLQYKDECVDETKAIESYTMETPCNENPCVNMINQVKSRCWTNDVDTLQTEMMNSVPEREKTLRCSQYNLLMPCVKEHIRRAEECPLVVEALTRTIDNDPCTGTVWKMQQFLFLSSIIASISRLF
ncbi:Uncharacterised protein r2_g970 [Pycnogonum litorale]